MYNDFDEGFSQKLQTLTKLYNFQRSSGLAGPWVAFTE
jgi:hypothetical protein